MLTACLIIIAWVVEMPRWASILITVLAALRFVCQPYITLAYKKTQG